MRRGKGRGVGGTWGNAEEEVRGEPGWGEEEREGGLGGGREEGRRGGGTSLNEESGLCDYQRSTMPRSCNEEVEANNTSFPGQDGSGQARRFHFRPSLGPARRRRESGSLFLRSLRLQTRAGLASASARFPFCLKCVG